MPLHRRSIVFEEERHVSDKCSERLGCSQLMRIFFYLMLSATINMHHIILAIELHEHQNAQRPMWTSAVSPESRSQLQYRGLCVSCGSSWVRMYSKRSLHPNAQGHRDNISLGVATIWKGRKGRKGRKGWKGWKGWKGQSHRKRQLNRYGTEGTVQSVRYGPLTGFRGRRNETKFAQFVTGIPSLSVFQTKHRCRQHK